ncbi:lipopolysaccharide assembly protein LapA domain-containing protein [Bacillus sp. FJAT-47783]|uniref:LapA family protein n=1 Tax=Bacillus sp. FJAT-47783 TaxID=2922712 RepID=UPI001FAB73C3|nr:lipopolysaccharide assembly protein LapA domain-containing protein [Bacillus sp. FJAT-47783]
MKKQSALILSLLFALIVSIFAVINVEPVEVDYLFGTANWPLVLVIVCSALMGAITVMSLGVVRFFSLQRQVNKLQRENDMLKKDIQEKSPNKEGHKEEVLTEERK